MDNQVTESSPLPVPPMITGGPSVVMEEKPRTFVDDLVRFQSDRQNKVPEKEMPESVVKKEEVVETTDHVDRPIQGKEGIFYNGKQYDQEEVMRVLKERDELSAKLVVKETVPVTPLSIEEDLETMMYTDPKRYNQIIQEKAARTALAHIENVRIQEKTKSDFYSTYKDLVGKEDLVEYHATKMQASLAKLPAPEALSKLAQAVRTRVSAIGGNKVATEELSSKPAVTAGATGSQSGSAPAATTPSSMSFIEQLKRVQRRGKTRY